MRNFLITICFLNSLCLLSVTTFADEYPTIIDPVVTATPPGAKVSAGYMAMTNNSAETLIITDAYSPDIPKVEIHLSSVVNDVAKMEKQDTLSIKPGDTLEFKHGSYHIMLMGLTEPLVENSSVDIILNTSAGEMLIEMPVRKLSHGMQHGADDKKMDKDNSENTMESMKHNDTMDEAKSDNDEILDDDVKPATNKVVH